MFDNLVYYTNLLNLPFETCGNFIQTNNILINQPQLETIGSKYTNPKSCQHKVYSSIIWHTHPVDSKPYPSSRDILKIIKNKLISTSIIFTTLGFWVLKYPFNIVLSNQQQEHHLKQIDNILLSLYNSYKKGNLNDFYNNIDFVKTMLQNRYKYFTIDFYPQTTGTT